jgi:Cu+-exporting ATPase
VAPAPGGRFDSPAGLTELVRLAASLEHSSEHPLAGAIVRYALELGLALAEPESFESLAGQGATGVVDGVDIVIGNAALLVSRGIMVGSLGATRDPSASGNTMVYVAVDGVPAGIIAVADPVRPTSRQAVERLRALGLRVVMLTGDVETTARAVAAQAGIGEVIAGVLPGAKAEHVARLQGQGAVVAMVGDGINDAPALARADVGIAIGTGTDIAAEAADVVLMRSDLLAAVDAILLSRRAMRTMRQNLFWAFVYNVIGIPVAAGVLYPATGLLLSPILASAAMAFSSVSVVSNSLRLRSA